MARMRFLPGPIPALLAAVLLFAGGFQVALIASSRAALAQADDSGDGAPVDEGVGDGAGAGATDEGSGDSGGVDDDLPQEGTAPVNVPSTPLPPAPSGPVQDFTLEALMAPDTPPLSAGVVWRIFATDSTGQKLELVSETTAGTLQAQLPQGAYYVHAAYGRAGLTKRIDVAPDKTKESIVLNAGGLRLQAFVGKETKLPEGLISFDIFVEDGEIGERTLVIPDAHPDKVIRLNAGTYHVIGRYGDANAVVRADVQVQAGKLTDAILYHKAAKVTLKLVSEHGGEALANTAWSVLTTGGDSIFNSVGAFPAVVLAAGQYTAIARHDDRTYRGTFTVETDLNRDIEVLATP
jgi:hypothetical protein